MNSLVPRLMQRVSVGRAPHCFLDWCHGRKGGSVIRTSVVAVLEVQSIQIGGPQLWRVAMAGRIVEIHQLLWVILVGLCRKKAEG